MLYVVRGLTSGSRLLVIFGLDVGGEMVFLLNICLKCGGLPFYWLRQIHGFSKQVTVTFTLQGKGVAHDR